MNPPSWRGLKTGRTSTTALSSPLMSSGETALEFEAPTRSLAGSLVSRSLIYDILLASAANAVNQADRNIMPIAVIPMAEEFGWSMMQRGLILSSFAYGYILTQLPGGWIATLLPPLKLLLLAVSVWSLATLLTPAAAGLGLGAVFACRVVLGVAEGFCLPAIFQLFARSVPVALRSRAFSFMLGCGSVGQLGALLLCPQLAPWPAMFLSFGGLGLGWAALCVLRLWCGPPAAAVERRGGGSSAEAEAEDGASAAEEESGLLAVRGCGGRGRGERDGGSLALRLLRCRPLHAICLAHFAQAPCRHAARPPACPPSPTPPRLRLARLSGRVVRTGPITRSPAGCPPTSTSSSGCRHSRRAPASKSHLPSL